MTGQRPSPHRLSPRSGLTISARPSTWRSPSTGRRSIAIAGSSAEPSFDNTIAALELSGRKLRRVSAVFFNLTGAHTNEALETIELRHGAGARPALERHPSRRAPLPPDRRA